MAPRFQRFRDSSEKFVLDADVAEVNRKVEEDLPSFVTIFEAEKAASESYAGAWAKATELFESKFVKSLGPKETKIVNKNLNDKLPESLRENPSYLLVAVIVITQEDGQNFIDEFHVATRSLVAELDWSSYGFKSLLMLLSQAQRNLSSRPNPEMNKFIFRTADERWNLNKGQHLSLGCFSSFTVRRNVAMRHLKEDGAAEDGGEEEEDATKGSACEGNPPTLVKIKFTTEVVGLGVKHLSPLSEDEREVLVSPLQSFTVTEVIKRAKKGFTVFMLEPVKA